MIKREQDYYSTHTIYLKNGRKMEPQKILMVENFTVSEALPGIIPRRRIPKIDRTKETVIRNRNLTYFFYEDPTKVPL
jgi:hypothetical protein